MDTEFELEWQKSKDKELTRLFWNKFNVSDKNKNDSEELGSWWGFDNLPINKRTSEACVRVTTYSPIFPKILDYFGRFPNTTEDFRRLLKMSEDYRVTFVLPSLLRYLEMRRLPEEFNLLCVDA